MVKTVIIEFKRYRHYMLRCVFIFSDKQASAPMTMTETGKKEEGVDIPLEGSPPRKVDANANDNSPTSVASLLMTPTSNRMSDADIFKTPEPVTPTSSAKKRKRLTPEEKNLREMVGVEFILDLWMGRICFVGVLLYYFVF